MVKTVVYIQGFYDNAWDKTVNRSVKKYGHPIWHRAMPVIVGWLVGCTWKNNSKWYT
jgi:hypothetical protein